MRVVGTVVPISKWRTSLEEAGYEDDGGENELEREFVPQGKSPGRYRCPILTVRAAMENLRVYRPRVVLHGPLGMGQGYVAAAALHHLEGYHVHSATS